MWIMSFDFGVKRIGISICNTELKIPHPIQVITGKNKFDKLDQISKLIEKWQPKHLVVGMPSINLLEDQAHANVAIANMQLIQKQNLILLINKFVNRLKNKFKLLTFSSFTTLLLSIILIL